MHLPRLSLINHSFVISVDYQCKKFPPGSNGCLKEHAALLRNLHATNLVSANLTK